MTAFRRLFLHHRALSGGIVALALLMKLLVPAGYMVGEQAGGIRILLCSGSAPQAAVMTMPGMAHHSGKSGHAGKELPCAFSALAAPSLAGADALLLAVAIAFIVATIVRIAAPPARQVPAYLRPPLRGPPTLP